MIEFKYFLSGDLKDSYIHIATDIIMQHALCGVSLSYSCFLIPPDITICSSCRYIRDSLTKIPTIYDKK